MKCHTMQHFIRVFTVRIRTCLVVSCIQLRVNCLFECLFVSDALRPKSTAMVMAGRSVHLTTLFPGQAISTKVWDRAGSLRATPGSAVRLASVARHVSDLATRPQLSVKTHTLLASMRNLKCLSLFAM